MAVTVRARIGGRFELGDFIAQGGMGAVYRGLDGETGQLVAIKRLKAELGAETAELVQRFAREGEILRRLDHPNIVKLLAVVTEGSQQYLVMEFVAGGSLRDVLISERQLSLGRALSVLLELADALGRAHHLKVIHRDLKPENVLIARDGTPRLSDFGSARMGDRSLTPTHRLIGTLSYLSPEAFMGHELDERADIWALGAVLFEMLVGHAPFQCDHQAGLVAAILHAPVPDVEALCPSAPVAVVDLIYRMLEKDRAQRIPRARQIAAEVEAILNQGDVSLSPTRRPHSKSPGSALRAPPDTRPSTPPRNDLPSHGTPFIGRERELAELSRLLADPAVRLVTLLGPGGMGKTRLAIEVGRRWATELPASSETLSHEDQPGRGVFLVELAPILSPDLIVSALGEAVGFRFYPGGEPLKQLIGFFRDKSLLLLMDNFEHLLPGAELVSELLKACPGLKVLITSRVRLALLAEAQYTLAGMSLPGSELAPDCLAFAAVQLFVDCARRVLPGFALGFDDLRHAARICRLVQGMPLGIVLAAAWVGLLSTEEIADEIAKSTDFLHGELRDIPQRQHSIRTIFEHSWVLLGAEERAVLARASIFRGGFNRPAAERVASANLRALAQLLNQSLLRRDAQSGRYEVHELIRQYAREKLDDIPALSASTFEQHADYFASFLAKRENQLRGVEQRQALKEIDADLAAVRAAWNWMLEHQRLDLVGRAMPALWLYYERAGSRHEAELAFHGVHESFQAHAQLSVEQRRVVGLALALEGWCCEEQGKSVEADALTRRALELLDPELHPSERARASMTAALYSFNRGAAPEQTLGHAVRAVALYRAANDHFGLAGALVLFGRISIHLRGDFVRAEASFRESVALQESFGDRCVVLPLSLAGLGNARAMQGHRTEGSELISRGLDIAERFRDLGSMHVCLRMLANVLRTLGNYALAEATIQRSLELASQCGNRDSQALCWLSLGDIQKEQGRLDEATQNYTTALAYGAHDGMKRAVAQLNLGDLALLGGQYAAARRYLTESLVGLETVKVRWALVLVLDNLGYLECRERAFDAAAAHYYRAFSIGLADNTLALVTNVVAGLAQLYAEIGQTERAAELLGLAKYHPATESQSQARRIGPLHSELERRLPPARLAAALRRGSGLDLHRLTAADFLQPLPGTV
ncbi:MAG: protein kinase [Deltaproteobacteria bacterium]